MLLGLKIFGSALHDYICVVLLLHFACSFFFWCNQTFTNLEIQTTRSYDAVSDLDILHKTKYFSNFDLLRRNKLCEIKNPNKGRSDGYYQWVLQSPLAMLFLKIIIIQLVWKLLRMALKFCYHKYKGSIDMNLFRTSTYEFPNLHYFLTL